MRKWMATLILAASVCIGTAAHAYFLIGSTLYPMSIAHDKASAMDRSITVDELDEAFQFAGYVIGTTDELVSIGAFCPTPEITEGQLLAMVSKYLKDHPDQWAMSASDLVYMALSPLLGCKSKGTQFRQSSPK